MKWKSVNRWDCAICRKSAVIIAGPLTIVAVVALGAFIGALEQLRGLRAMFRNAWNGVH